MTVPKKRTLNEMRQTKDTFYIVPELKKEDNTLHLFKEFFNNKNNISAANYLEFVSFIKEKGFQIIKK